MRRWFTPLVLFAGSAATGLQPIADGDVFWHLAAGREMVRTGAPLLRDPFSSGAAGRPWVDVHWLFQLGAYGLHQLGGLGALVLAKCALIGLSSLVTYAALERRARPLYPPIAIGALFCARQLLLVRPVIVSLVLLALFWLLLERFRCTDRAAWLLPLPLLQMVWSNCQGLSALGPLVLGAHAAAAASEHAFGRYAWYPFAPERTARWRAGPAVPRLRALLLALGGCSVASLLTPYGLRALQLPGELLARLLPHAGNPYAQVAENAPPFARGSELAAQFWHLPWFLGLLALSFVFARRRVLLSHTMLVAGFVALALIANRNVLLLYFAAAPIAARQLVPALARARSALRRGRALRPARWLARAALAVLLVAVCAAAAREPRWNRPTPFHFPQASAAWLASRGGSGVVFAADHQGGYLIWTLTPNFKPYIDTRLVLRTPEEYGEYLAIVDNPHRFEAFAHRAAITHVVLPIAYPDRYLGLIAQLYPSAEWKLVFTDGTEVLFTRRAGTAEPAVDLQADATTDRLLAAARARFGHDARLLDAARLQLAALQLAAGALDQARRTLATSSSPAALALRARACLVSGDLECAARFGGQLLRKDEDGAASHHALMARVYLSRGQSAAAVAALARAIEADPLEREATRLLAGLEAGDER